jgi:hypothetical protein
MSRRRRGRRINAKGRSTNNGRHIQLTHFMLQSVAWRSLRPIERALYIEVLLRYTGFNNGSIGLGVREAGEALYAKPHTAGTAFDVLVERGFLALGKDSSFGQKKLTREWRVTSLPMGPWDAPTSSPTHDYMRWRPAAEKHFPVPFEDTFSAPEGHTSPEIDPQKPRTVPLRGTNGSPLSAAEGHTSISTMHSAAGAEHEHSSTSPCSTSSTRREAARAPRSGRNVEDEQRPSSSPHVDAEPRGAEPLHQRSVARRQRHAPAAKKIINHAREKFGKNFRQKKSVARRRERDRPDLGVRAASKHFVAQ